MPSNIELESLISQDARVPLNVAPLLHLLQNRQDDFAIRLVDVLRQMQVALELIWRTLKSEFPEYDSFELLAPDGSSATTLGYEFFQVKSLTTDASFSAGPNSFNIIEGTDELEAIVTGDSIAMNLVRNSNVDIQIQTTPSGIVIALGAGGKFMINGVQVVAAQQATVNSVSGTAGATYTATEQGMLNNVVARFNELRTRLQAHGLIA